MPYWRTDLEQGDGRHIALFAESDEAGAIQQQFGLSIDGPMADPSLVQLVTFADVAGRPLVRIDPQMGWKRTSPEEYEIAVELKRQIYQRDEALRRARLNRCARCGGNGRMLHEKLQCPDCKGTGQVQPSDAASASSMFQ